MMQCVCVKDCQVLQAAWQHHVQPHWCTQPLLRSPGSSGHSLPSPMNPKAAQQQSWMTQTLCLNTPDDVHAGLGLPGTHLLLHSKTAAELSDLTLCLNMPDDVHVGLGLSDTHLLLHSNTAAELYDITLAPPQMAFAFTCLQSLAPVLQGDFLFRAEGTSIEICSMAGAVEQTLVLSEVSSSL